ncbi:DUF389 domain-containing protein [Candidatus Nomurabacteria bacterium]|nr:DUF389 domain-containing protein [Candidatus Nomurabacteria bacterium]MCB9820674.1 DUF389 domain-containing protein [Candidatus Nomurabacteria bacterium]
MLNEIFSATINKNDKLALIKEIKANLSSSKEYYVLMITSAAMATCAILLDSIAILIASMIIAPLLQPILGISVGFSIRDQKITKDAINIFIRSVIYTLGISVLFTFLFGVQGVGERFIVSFENDLFLSIIVAAFSGFIATYGMIHPKVSSSLTGIAIAVSLVPPLAAVGVGIASLDGSLIRYASGVFVVNIIGIIIASIITLILMNINEINNELDSVAQSTPTPES